MKVSEQNLATFFFYKAFIDEELLPFDVLLNKYFIEHAKRFEDTVIPANNNFGHAHVMRKLKPHLKNYLVSVTSNWDTAFKFINAFWFYLQDETFEYLFDYVSNLADSDTTEYIYNLDDKALGRDKDDVLALLSEFLRFPNEKLADALELSFEYVRKTKENFQQLMQTIKERLIFDRDDERSGFYRQETLYDVLLKHLDDDPGYLKAFFELSKNFLAFKFQHSKGGRNYTITIYWYALSNSPRIRSLRNRIWVALEEKFKKDVPSAISLLESYAQRNPDVDKDIMTDDVPFIIDI